MTIEDVDWLLRYPADEIVLSQDNLNRIQSAVSTSQRTGLGVVYNLQHDEATGRRVNTPSEIAGRKIRIEQSNYIRLAVKGVICACVIFSPEIYRMEDPKGVVA